MPSKTIGPRRLSGRFFGRPRRGNSGRNDLIETLESRVLLTPVTVELTPDRDNTIFSENTNSAGADDGLFSGRTNQGARRRALVHFDIAGLGIPAVATVTEVSLQMRVSQGFGSDSFALHRATTDWGEGASVGTGTGGGRGGAPTTNDATWQHSFFSGSTWTAPGGDFDLSASASTVVGGVGNYTWSSQGLIDDVNAWLATPAENFGWFVIGDEAANRSARRFDSKDHATPGNRPVLTVTYDDPTIPPDLTIADVAVDEGDSGTTRVNFSVTLSAATNQQVIVNYQTSDSTATIADNDYVAGVGTIRFDPGVTSQTIAVDVVGDETFESDEFFLVDIVNATNANIADSRAIGTIRNDDPQQQAAGLDPDDSGDANLFTDGILIARHLAGFTGSALTENATAANAGRTVPVEISTFLDNDASLMLDADNNDFRDLFTDGILIARFLAGFTGAALTENAIGASAARTDPQDIVAFLQTWLPRAGNDVAVDSAQPPERRATAPARSQPNSIPLVTGIEPAAAVSAHLAGGNHDRNGATFTVAPLAAPSTLTAGAHPSPGGSDIRRDLDPTLIDDAFGDFLLLFAARP